MVYVVRCSGVNEAPLAVYVTRPAKRAQPPLAVNALPLNVTEAFSVAGTSVPARPLPTLVRIQGLPTINVRRYFGAITIGRCAGRTPARPRPTPPPARPRNRPPP